MNLQASEFIAKTLAPDNNPQRIAAWPLALSYASGTTSSGLSAPQRGPHQWIHAKTGLSLSHEQFAARMRGNTRDLPVILFDPPLDTNTDKENNND